MTSTESAQRNGNADREIAAQLREAILDGTLAVEQRLPGEQELAARFGVSRPTVREALKRLAAQNLIHTRRGASGGSFVNRITWSEAHEQLVTTATFLVSMTPIEAEQVAEARLAMLSSCVPLAVERRTAGHIAGMRAEIDIQRDPNTCDIGFCASDVRFHRIFADSASNPLLSFQMAGVIEAIQPLLNMITYRDRDRAAIVDGHERICNALEARDAAALTDRLALLCEEIARLVRDSQARRRARGRS